VYICRGTFDICESCQVFQEIMPLLRFDSLHAWQSGCHRCGHCGTNAGRTSIRLSLQLVCRILADCLSDGEFFLFQCVCLQAATNKQKDVKYINVRGLTASETSDQF